MSLTRQVSQRRVALRRADFGRYTDVVKGLMGDAIAVVLCDLSGRRVWSLSRDAREAYAKALETLNESIPDWPSNGTSVRHCTIDDMTSAY
ncbi:MAG: hypothetical protein AAFU65_04930, partial [Pseudomonadota bacterium]